LIFNSFGNNILIEVAYFNNSTSTRLVRSSWIDSCYNNITSTRFAKSLEIKIIPFTRHIEELKIDINCPAGENLVGSQILYKFPLSSPINIVYYFEGVYFINY